MIALTKKKQIVMCNVKFNLFEITLAVPTYLTKGNSNRTTKFI